LTEANGTPRAVLVGIGPAASPAPITDWNQQWGKLTTQIDQAWQVNKAPNRFWQRCVDELYHRRQCFVSAAATGGN